MKSQFLTVITGSSSGIGAATARRLAQSGHNLWLIARRQERLTQLANELKAHSVDVLQSTLDVSDRNAVAQWAQTHANEIKRVRTLINNAGLAKGVAAIQQAKMDDFETMIDTNLKGLLYMTRALLPTLTEARDGHIVNIGSVAGRWVYPGGNVYCASKSAVHSLTEGLRFDLLGLGVRVSEILPGMVETEFSEVRLDDKQKAKAVYAGMTALSADDVAQSIEWCLNRPKHVNIQEIVIYPTDQAAPGHVSRRP